jgi:hypothetical protein
MAIRSILLGDISFLWNFYVESIVTLLECMSCVSHYRSCYHHYQAHIYNTVLTAILVVTETHCFSETDSMTVKENTSCMTVSEDELRLFLLKTASCFRRSCIIWFDKSPTTLPSSMRRMNPLICYQKSLSPVLRLYYIKQVLHTYTRVIIHVHVIFSR